LWLEIFTEKLVNLGKMCYFSHLEAATTRIEIKPGYNLENRPSNQSNLGVGTIFKLIQVF
jgi:hypothetical protein